MSLNSHPHSRAEFPAEHATQAVRVAVNATSLLYPLTGIGQYTQNLMQAIHRRGHFELFYFYGHGWGRELRAAPMPGIVRAKEFVKRVVPNPHEVFRAVQRLQFRRGVRKFRCELFHDPNYLPFEFSGAVVNTVHDLSFIRYPETHPALRIRFLEKYLPSVLERCNGIITDSGFVRDEVVSVFGVDPAKVHPIHLGVSPAYHPRPPEETTPVLSKYGLTHGRYVLAVGTLEPRKNLVQGLRAFRTLPEALRETMPFVIVGMKGWLTDGIEAEIGTLESRGQVRVLGYLTTADLLQLYAGATMLLYPSVYEGFGLPALEAGASGIPVITSNRSSLPEVVGEVGITVDPGDEQGFADAIRMLADDPIARAARGVAGVERARQFTWARCAVETERVYRIALADV
jgi:alpha-1,3-rhamnosyl/mannosyltransferase